ncbi:MAG: hypothetical protein WCX70_01105 [Candidatus Paceibacterota bacterium]|jgi:hypothetical protein
MKEIIENIFTTEFFTTLLSVLGGVFIASLTYYLSKKKEREADWQKEKLNFYIEFISSITDNLKCGSTAEGAKRFARASNNLYLFASPKVITALTNYQDEIRASNKNRSAEGEARALGNLIFQMRKDMKIKYNRKNVFDSVKPWGWGIKNSGSKNEIIVNLEKNERS